MSQQKDRKDYGFTERRREIFLETLATSGNVSLSARTAGVETPTVYNARKNDPAFAEKWKLAQETAADYLEAEARRRAMETLRRYKFTKTGDPILDPEDPEKKRYYYETHYNNALLTLLLKANKPEKFRDRIETLNLNADLEPHDELVALVRKSYGQLADFADHVTDSAIERAGSESDESSD